jgi:transposase
MLIGYFEGLDSERGIAWRAADSLAIRRFLRVGLDEAVADHSTISRTRRLIDVETHRAVFTWIQQRPVERGLPTSGRISIDGTTLEVNPALRSIVRRASAETYQEFLTKLAQASGIETPTREDVAQIDKKRPKKGSNDDWQHPQDPDAAITKMKDGRTYLAHKAKHAIDLACGAIVAVTGQRADAGDTQTIQDTSVAAAEQLEATVGLTGATVLEVVSDKGYHSNDVLTDFAALGVRAHISEPQRGRRNWTNRASATRAVYANRRRIRGARGHALRRRRSESLERSFAHTYETGGMRRTHLRGHANILKRLLAHAGGFNLGLVMRALIGVGTPRGPQDRVRPLLASLSAWWPAARDVQEPFGVTSADVDVHRGHLQVPSCQDMWSRNVITPTTGCQGSLIAHIFVDRHFHDVLAIGIVGNRGCPSTVTRFFLGFLAFPCRIPMVRFLLIDGAVDFSSASLEAV